MTCILCNRYKNNGLKSCRNCNAVFMTDSKCSGCQRQEVHKMCPAWNTPFYMSGIPFSNTVEKFYNELDESDKQILFEIINLYYCFYWLDEMKKYKE